jgi:hypothetical protein
MDPMGHPSLLVELLAGRYRKSHALAVSERNTICAFGNLALGARRSTIHQNERDKNNNTSFFRQSIALQFQSTTVTIDS